MRKVLRRQRTVLGRLMREVQRKLPGVGEIGEKLRHKLETVLERAGILHRQKPKGKNKLYAMHAPEVECISKGCCCQWPSGGRGRPRCLLVADSGFCRADD